MVRPLLTGAMLATIVAPVLRPQTPEDLRFVLATQNGRTQFRLGEAIEVEFRFSSSNPSKYRVWTAFPYRRERLTKYDHFIAEPSEGVADPLTDIVVQVPPELISGSGAPAPNPMGAQPTVVATQVNEWLAIRKPGHYRIHAETTRVTDAAAPYRPIPLRSNSIDVDVVAPEEGWAANELRQARAELESAPADRKAVFEHAARTLRFLETPDAAKALADLCERAPREAQWEIEPGLFASPHRSAVIAAMQSDIAAADFPVTDHYIALMAELEAAARFGPTPQYTGITAKDVENTIADMAKMQPFKAEGYRILAASVADKRGTALAQSLETLVAHGPDPVPAETAKALLDHFEDLPEAAQSELFSQYWPKIASPDLEPLLRSMATGNSLLRDTALWRLQELDPDAARPLLLDRIRHLNSANGDGRGDRLLYSLPDRVLPELDDALAGALEQNKRGAQGLVARYASKAILPRLNPNLICQPELTPYFFRVDAEWAASALAAMRQSSRTRCPLYVSPEADLLMSPGLERQAIEDLSSTDPDELRGALQLLRSAGSGAAEKPVLDAFTRFRAGNGADRPENVGIEDIFVEAVVSAVGWVPSEDTLQEAFNDCTKDWCRKHVESVRTRLKPPLPINVDSLSSDLMLYGLVTPSEGSVKQLTAHIALFPKGTEFYLTGADPGTWWYEQQAAKVRRILTDAGMKEVAQPVHPQ